MMWKLKWIELTRTVTIAEVIEEDADELGGCGWMSDGKFDDELTFIGSDVGDKLRNKNERRKKNHFLIIFSLNISHSKSCCTSFESVAQNSVN